jgi:hypothetical protein
MSSAPWNKVITLHVPLKGHTAKHKSYEGKQRKYPVGSSHAWRIPGWRLGEWLAQDREFHLSFAIYLTSKQPI